MTKRMGVGAVKARMSEVLRDVEAHGGRVVIERRGKPIAVIQPYRHGPGDVGQHWAAALDGVAAGIADFARITSEVVASRKRARPRPVELPE